MQERFTGKSGADLIALRERLGVSQKHIADAMGTTATTLYRWERGLVRMTPLRYARYEAAANAVFAAQVEGAA
jgi:transcriptional regulator with XRE-family HTH domain